tara:strand:- start:4002 stop:4184 length:183 start_codon:yes stop_codon:yes gene_type:complete
MGLLKPMVTFLTGYFLIKYYNQYKEQIKEITLVGDKLYNLAEKHRDMMILLIISIVAYFI